ncbi:hypothetical protein CONCODRAFT_7570 [Conidiobolus coronatus NRRL 28638]|uniref:Uncharacterized protein n=1 Tax=Conidiobolus coronatus (strain ATCC 28846 / CBS 209.66 / NRRL 28638) TaxID=796925 RepID=A0A137P4K0_CONC2|nr:hypothetical protein CONCODRAFT_7570 [Conidiobolus coronatus NRRL 28638]|eukprot:KXN69925.1 hypothetical protein CONCODRAFT_7570 [Conidiobolus coronatus NRRL 28638]
MKTESNITLFLTTRLDTFSTEVSYKSLRNMVTKNSAIMLRIDTMYFAITVILFVVNIGKVTTPTCTRRPNVIGTSSVFEFFYLKYSSFTNEDGETRCNRDSFGILSIVFFTIKSVIFILIINELKLFYRYMITVF